MGCGASPDVDEASVAAERSAITGGMLLPAAFHSPPDTSVIKFEAAPHTCTGMKVGSNVFWSAAHCLDGVPTPTQVKMTNNLEGTFAGPQFHQKAINTVSLHPSYLNYIERIHVGGTLPEHYDVARFTVVGTTNTIPSYSKIEPMDIIAPAQVSYTGYGCDNAQGSSNGGKKQYQYFNLAHASEWFAFMPGPKIDYFLHNMINIGETPQGCSGDSGAPLFYFNEGEWRIAGITIVGGLGHTAWARYTNVRNWLASPAHNQFTVGSNGFIFNQATGRCMIATGNGEVWDSFCAGATNPGWTLRQSGTSNEFYLLNSATGKCLDVTSNAVGAGLVERTCLAATPSTNTQKWRFASQPRPSSSATAAGLYRQVVNASTSLCVGPSNATPPPGEHFPLRMQTCTTHFIDWRKQAFVMTR